MLLHLLAPARHPPSFQRGALLPEQGRPGPVPPSDLDQRQQHGKPPTRGARGP